MPVHPAVAAALLSWASATDNREVTPEASIAWADALDSHVTLEDGKAAITTHRRASTDWLMPMHVNTEVRRIRKIRTDAIGPVNPPAALDGDPGRTIAWTRAYVRASGDGETPEAAMKRACDELGISVPLQLEPIPRPEEVRRLMAAPKRQCECQPPCMEAHVRPEEGK